MIDATCGAFSYHLYSLIAYLKEETQWNLIALYPFVGSFKMEAVISYYKFLHYLRLDYYCINCWSFYNYFLSGILLAS